MIITSLSDFDQSLHSALASGGSSFPLLAPLVAPLVLPHLVASLVLPPLVALSKFNMPLNYTSIAKYDIAYLLLSLDGPISDLERAKFKELISTDIKKELNEIDDDNLEIKCLSILATIKKLCGTFLKTHCDSMPDPKWTVCRLLDKLEDNIKSTYQYQPGALRKGILSWIFLAMCDNNYTEYEKVFIQGIAQAASCAECNASSIREAEGLCATVIDIQKEIEALGIINENNKMIHNALQKDLKSIIDSMQNFIQFG